jgi:two-component system, response regulator, stage 0 sporulation protein F
MIAKRAATEEVVRSSIARPDPAALGAGVRPEGARSGPSEKMMRRFREPLASDRVLVAEDDPATRELFAWSFRRDGFDVVEACDGVELFEAIEAAVHVGGREGPPLSLIVSDVRMPGLSGLDVLWILRAGRWRVPVILTTAFSDVETRAEARTLGAWAVLDKPFPLEDLMLLAGKALRRNVGAR